LGFIPEAVAQLSTGEQIVPESASEQDYLVNVANNPNYTPEQKDRLAQLGTLVNPKSFDINFDQNRRDQYPTELDDPLRRMIRGS